MAKLKPRRLVVRNVDPNTVKENPKNPREHTDQHVQQIANSIKQFGFCSPILVDEDGVTIAGVGRLRASKVLGLATVPVISIRGLTAAEAMALNIADNKLTENSAWNRALLGEIFTDLSAQDLNFDLGVTGFEVPEIKLIIDTTLDVGSDAAPEQVETVGPLQKIAVSRAGDLWQCGPHRIFCHNALERQPYSILMGGKKARMVFTDPPYNVPIKGHVSGKGKTTHREFQMASGEMAFEDFTDFLARAFVLASRHTMPASVIFSCMDWRHQQEILAAGQEARFELLNLCVWIKSNGGMGSLYRSRHELVFVFKNGRGKHVNNVELGRHGRNRTNVWEYAGVNSFVRNDETGNLLEMHPTAKPTKMVADAILDCSHRGDIVLDPFLGAGATLLAAERVGRVCYGIEIDPLYVDVAIERWQSWTGQDAIHASSGLRFCDTKRRP
jgi:DNA modification methylase